MDDHDEKIALAIERRRCSITTTYRDMPNVIIDGKIVIIAERFSE